MIPREAIQKAIQGGYGGRFDSPEIILASHSQYQLALSASFWQALGKALGWRTGMTFADIFDGRELSGWEYHAHRFYDLILTGKPTDNFWKEILN